LQFAVSFDKTRCMVAVGVRGNPHTGSFGHPESSAIWSHYQSYMKRSVENRSRSEGKTSTNPHWQLAVGERARRTFGIPSPRAIDDVDDHKHQAKSFVVES